MKPPYDPRVLAERELALPGKYQLHAALTTEKPSLQQQVLEWLYDRFSDVWKFLFGHVHLSNTGSLVISDAVVAAVAALVVFVLYRFLVQVRIERTTRQETENSALAVARSAHTLYLQALDLSKRGEFSAAVRTLFLAAVVGLDLRGVVRDDASSTVGDVRRYLRTKNAQLVPAFDGVAQPFIRAAYAEVPLDAAAWEQAIDGYTRLTREVSG